MEILAGLTVAHATRANAAHRDVGITQSGIFHGRKKLYVTLEMSDTKKYI